MKDLLVLLQAQFDKMCATSKLFRSQASGQEVWDTYLSSFSNPGIWRDPSSNEYNCNLCNNFIRRYGNIVAVDSNLNLMSIFDVQGVEEYDTAMLNMSTLIKSRPIQDVFVETYDFLNTMNYGKTSKSNEVFALGLPVNHKVYTAEEVAVFGRVEEKKSYSFHHFSLEIPKAFIDLSGKSVEAIQGEFRSNKDVFLRGLQELNSDVLSTVYDLIEQGSLLDAATHADKVFHFHKFVERYANIPNEKADIFAWVNSYKLNIAKFRNELIGVFCTEIAEGDIEKACLNWNKRVDPANYMRASAPITAKQISDAKNFVDENGYAESFTRRCANIDDISVSEVKHANAGDGKIKTVSVFDNIQPTKANVVDISKAKIEEIGIEDFMSDILPKSKSVEAYLEPRHANNSVVMTTAENPDSKPIFKWSNNYSWSYKGNLAGVSMIKEAVKSQGGTVEAFMRGSLIWNENGNDNSDLDLHTQEPLCSINYSSNFRKDRGNVFSPCGGQLDLDNTGPQNRVGVENIYYLNNSKMRAGDYIYAIHQFSDRNSQGYKFELEINGEVFNYEHNGRVSGMNKIVTVHYKTDGSYTLTHHVKPTGRSSKEVGGLDTNNFHIVNLLCLSPNHWGENSTGNKHIFFMLKDFKVEEKVRGFHNENLLPDLLQHRKVMEVLGSTSLIEPSGDTLAGVGFNATVRDSLTVRVDNARLYNIKF